jgi:hypothetical protein
MRLGVLGIRGLGAHAYANVSDFRFVTFESGTLGGDDGGSWGGGGLSRGVSDGVRTVAKKYPSLPHLRLLKPFIADYKRCIYVGLRSTNSRHAYNTLQALC